MEPAVQPLVDNSWLVNNPASYASVANPVFPGPITTSHAGGPDEILGRNPVGGQGDNPIPADSVDDISEGGGYYEGAHPFTHAAPTAAFEAQGNFAQGSGPVSDVHSTDDGGYARKTYVDQPQSQGWLRRTLSGLTWNRQSYNYTPEGFMVNVANNRTDLDQYQVKDYPGYAPYWIPYSERPIYANFAYEAQAINTPPSAYVPSGALPNMTPTGGQGNNVYTAPPNPPVNTSDNSGGSTDESGWF